ncbi:MAG: ketol-acid reductoisomerase, partial [Candidatus Zixiibacteriota bacterium]
MQDCQGYCDCRSAGRGWRSVCGAGIPFRADLYTQRPYALMARSRIYHGADCDPEFILKKQITVLGYGSQGRAFALNLRDSGCNVQVALREDSASRQQVLSERLPLRSMAAVDKSDVVIFAIPDHEQPEFYRRHFSNEDRSNRTLVFLHGLNIHFGNIVPNPRYDVVLLAPHGPGKDLRDKYVQGNGMSCFLAVAGDASGKALKTGLSLAAAIGADKTGIYETTFEHETLGDLFGEQTLLVGGLAGLTMAVFQTMIDNDIPPENASLATVRQLRMLVSMIAEHGPAGMIAHVSKTAAHGSFESMQTLFDRQFG